MPTRSLDAAAVVREAVRAADERGVAELTMRRLGARMGVQAMALYHYVEGRDSLLDAMVETMMNELTLTMTRNTSTPTSAAVYLHDTAYDVRDLAITHPWLVRLMVRRPPPGGGLRWPLSGVACTNAFFAALQHRGYTPAASVTAYRQFCAFLLGHLLTETSSATDKAVQVRQPVRGSPTLRRLSGVPHTEAFYGLVAVEDYPAEFESSLRAFVRSGNHPAPNIRRSAPTDLFKPNQRGTPT